MRVWFVWFRVSAANVFLPKIPFMRFQFTRMRLFNRTWGNIVGTVQATRQAAVVRCTMGCMTAWSILCDITLCALLECIYSRIKRGNPVFLPDCPGIYCFAFKIITKCIPGISLVGVFFKDNSAVEPNQNWRPGLSDDDTALLRSHWVGIWGDTNWVQIPAGQSRAGWLEQGGGRPAVWCTPADVQGSKLYCLVS